MTDAKDTKQDLNLEKFEELTEVKEAVKKATPDELKEIPAEVPDKYDKPKYSNRILPSCLRGYDTQAGIYRTYYNGLNQYKDEAHEPYYPVAKNYDSYPLYRNKKMINLLLNTGLNRQPPKRYEDWRGDKLYRLKVPDTAPVEFGRLPPIIDGEPDPAKDNPNEKPVMQVGNNPQIKKPTKTLFSIPN